MARVAGVAGRVVRGTVIACGVAAVAGVGIGYVTGEPVHPDDIASARRLPTDFCQRLGDVSSLLPKATAAPKMTQTGTGEVHCRAAVDEESQTGFTAASLDLWITPYGGKMGGANQPPLQPATVAREAFEQTKGKALPNRPYPTKLDWIGQTGGQDWTISVVVLRADIVVRVEYKAYPLTGDKAEQAALVMADRAIWESK